MLFDRAPEARIGRVVDDHDAFEIGPIELGHAVQRFAQHLRRLAVGRNVNRDQRPLRQDQARRKQPLGRGAKQNRCQFLDPLLHDDDQRHEQPYAGDGGDQRAGNEIVRGRIVEHVRAPGADDLRRAGEHAGLDRGHPRNGEDRQAKQEAEPERGEHVEHPIRRLNGDRRARISAADRHRTGPNRRRRCLRRSSTADRTPRRSSSRCPWRRRGRRSRE